MNLVFNEMFRQVDYEHDKSPLNRTVVEDHPLSASRDGRSSKASKSISLSTKQHSYGMPPWGDPLSNLMDGSDPLTQMAMADSCQQVSDVSPLDVKSWKSMRASIASRFSTQQLITVSTSSANDDNEPHDLHVHSKAKWRLAYLELFDRGSSKKVHGAHIEVVAHIKRMRSDLHEAWNAEQRVKALKIVIQCCKLLEHTTLPHFYPTLFLFITDILDDFGEMVYNRIITKDQNVRVVGTAPPRSGSLSDTALETGRNWFYKVSSIKELVARLYVEMSILRCYDLLWPGTFTESVVRLSSTVHCVGNPIVSAYLRCYLCRVAGLSAAETVLSDFLVLFEPATVALSYRQLPLTAPDGRRPVLAPALEWCLHNAITAMPPAQLPELLHELLERCTHGGHGLLLFCMLKTVGCERIASSALAYTKAVVAETGEAVSQCDLLLSLGEQLTTGSVSQKDVRPVLTAVWSAVQELRVDDYIRCVPAWVGFVGKYMRLRQLDAIIADIVSHVAEIGSLNRDYPQLERIVDQLIDLSNINVASLMKLRSFSSLLESIQEDATRVRVYRRLVGTLVTVEPTSPLHPELVDIGMQWCHTLHESITLMSVEDERRQVGDKICRFLTRACDVTSEHQRDGEVALELLVEARGRFCNLQSVLVHLVLSACSLAVRWRPLAAACVAFCYITVPTLDAPVARVRLHALSAQVALQCACVGQADACMRSAVSGLVEVPGTQTGAVSELVRCVTSALLAFPDQPSKSPLCLPRGLLAALQRAPALQEPHVRVPLLMDLLRLAAAMAQHRYLYRAPDVDANDVLYGRDPGFIQELTQLGQDVIEHVVELLLPPGGEPLNSAEARAAAEFTLAMLRCCHAEVPLVRSAAKRLYSACTECSDVPQQQLSLIRDCLTSAASQS